jgi:hypothetical protein
MCEVPPSLWRHLTHQRSHNRAVRCVRCRQSQWSGSMKCWHWRWHCSARACTGCQLPRLLLLMRHAAQQGNCPPVPRLPLLQHYQPRCRRQTATGLKKAALCCCNIKVVPLQNCYTQNIVGFDRERGIFSTDFFRWYGIVCRKRHRNQHNKKNNRNTYYFLGKKIDVQPIFSFKLAAHVFCARKIGRKSRKN